MAQQQQPHAPTRRTVVFSMAGGALAASVLSTKQLDKPRSFGPADRSFFGNASPLAEANFEQWSTEVGSTFFATTEVGAVALRLTAVETIPIRGKRPGHLRKQPFEAHFELDRSSNYPMGGMLYAVRHPDHGTFNVFFSAAPGALKAIFN